MAIPNEDDIRDQVAKFDRAKVSVTIDGVTYDG